MLTLEAWLDTFTQGAATLPGWRLTRGKLRRLEADSGRYACPLMAQWNLLHSEERVTENLADLLVRRWEGVLGAWDAWQVMDAADDPILPGHAEPLRAALLRACGVAEAPEDEEDGC